MSTAKGQWEAASIGVGGSDGRFSWGVRWSHADDNGRWLYVRRFTGPKSQDNKFAAECSASALNDYGRLPSEFAGWNSEPPLAT
jgi:hypothetical protein